jgi:hypothetical protein
MSEVTTEKRPSPKKWEDDEDPPIDQEEKNPSPSQEKKFHRRLRCTHKSTCKYLHNGCKFYHPREDFEPKRDYHQPYMRSRKVKTSWIMSLNKDEISEVSNFFINKNIQFSFKTLDD